MSYTCNCTDKNFASFEFDLIWFANIKPFKLLQIKKDICPTSMLLLIPCLRSEKAYFF